MDVFQIRVPRDELCNVHARAAFQLNVRHQQASFTAGDQQSLLPGGKHLARFAETSGTMVKPGKIFMLRMRPLRFQ